MADFEKIPYYDIRTELARGILPECIGRRAEFERLTRVLHRRIHNNCFIVAPAGIGKTTFVYGWMKQAIKDEANKDRAFVQFDAGHLETLADDEYRYAQALATLPLATIFIDDFGRAMHGSKSAVERLARLYSPILRKPDMRIIATMTPEEHAWLSSEHPAFARLFEPILLKAQTTADHVAILESAVARLNPAYGIVVPTATLQVIVEYIERFPVLGRLPRAGTLLLDECLACAKGEGKDMLTEEIVQKVVAGKTDVPLAQLRSDELAGLGDLEAELNARVVSQEAGIKKISSAITRAKLGMRNPNRPLGSFLILGPSGVGKTETAKIVAEKVFGRQENFIRFDMSEFGQEHMVQRLIGAPPGYIGYESGGALTERLKTEPYSLLLLDEIEKAHPKIFDVFLQVLDDGRITSGRNETVDARHSIIMATSNIAVPEILAGFESGEDVHSEKFLRDNVMPALALHFRMEFLNRFDSILIFNPLKLQDLLKIAQLEIKKVEKRLAKHNVRFDVDPAVLEKRVGELADMRFGARPIRRFIEDACETLLVQSLLADKKTASKPAK